MSTPRRIVAELGRPETLEETADRKARDRRLRRERQNWRNLVGSLVVCLLLVAAIVAIIPRPDSRERPAVDYRTAARQARDDVPVAILAPALPSRWRANAAELRRRGDITSWYTGFVTPSEDYLAYSEGIDATPGWLATTVAHTGATGTTRIGGLTWRVHDRRRQGERENLTYALSTALGRATVVVYGTAAPAEARVLAAALARQARSLRLAGTGGA